LKKIGRKEVMKIILIIIYLILTVSGLILMKMGGNTGNFEIKDQNINFGISLISALGFICYILSFLIFTKIISMFDLSYIYPIITGIVQILSLVLSSLVLKERISWQIVVGTIIVILGIMVMNIKR